jgi:hypothetical protein
MLFTEKKIISGPALASVSTGKLLWKNKKKEMLFTEKLMLASTRAPQRSRSPVVSKHLALAHA